MSRRRAIPDVPMPSDRRPPVPGRGERADRDPRYSSRRWQLLRLKIIRRDGNACTHCGGVEGLEVDHIIRPEDGGGFWCEQNLRTLCGLDHRRKTRNGVMARRRGAKPKPLIVKVERW